MFRSLASGSSGNAYLLRTGKTTLLFEAGLRLPMLQKYLAAEDVALHRLSAVLISHEHRDHCVAARELAEEYGVPIWANADVLRAAGLHGMSTSAVLEVNSPALFGDVEVTCFPIPHDAVRPVGFRIRVADRTIVVATDLGEVSDAVANVIGEADLVVLEANHDTEMLQQGRYPYQLRRRVSGPTGHLSNAQAGAALSRRLKDESVEVWLAHLSRENNTPNTALQTVRRLLKSAGFEAVLPGIARRDRPSLRWTGVPRPRQLSLFSGFEPL